MSNQATTSMGPKPIVFRGEHPDKRTDKEWVKYMCKKYPELGWMSAKQLKKIK